MHIHAEATEGVEARIRDAHELSRACWEPNPGPRQEQQVPLTSGPSLQSLEIRSEQPIWRTQWLGRGIKESPVTVPPCVTKRERLMRRDGCRDRGSKVVDQWVSQGLALVYLPWTEKTGQDIAELGVSTPLSPGLLETDNRLCSFGHFTASFPTPSPASRFHSTISWGICVSERVYSPIKPDENVCGYKEPRSWGSIWPLLLKDSRSTVSSLKLKTPQK